jgi:hypothetical protein
MQSGTFPNHTNQRTEEGNGRQECWRLFCILAEAEKQLEKDVSETNDAYSHNYNGEHGCFRAHMS